MASTVRPNFLKEIIKSTRRAFYFVIVFSCFVNVLMLTVSLYMLQIFDRVFASHSYDTLIYLTIIAIFAIAILAILDYLRSRILLFISHWLDVKMSPEALRRSIDNLLHGDSYAPQSLRDITVVRTFLSGYGMISLLDSPWVPIYLFVIFLLQPILGIVAVIGAVLLFTLAVINEKRTRDLSLEVNAKGQKIQTQVSATLKNAETIQAMGMLSSIIQRWLTENEEILKLQVDLNQKSGSIIAISKFSRLAIQICMLGVGAYLVIQNELTAGAMIAASIILSRALAPIEQAITVWNQFMTARQAYDRLNRYFQVPEQRRGDISLPRPKGYLSVENVSFVPPGSKQYILRNIQFTLAPGEVLAITGPSAAGKTSLARLLVGAYPPTLGNVRLDDADVFAWERTDLGQYMGYLPQYIELFKGTVKENIARMRIDPPNDEIIKAGQNAFAHEMILRLPDGYDTPITESSMNLSAGQRQRIALARAFYGNPQLIVLDEPNSNLDNEGEMALLKAISKAKEEKKTIIFIAHRSAMIGVADKILVLKEGQMLAFGPTKEVIEKLKSEQNKTS